MDGAPTRIPNDTFFPGIAPGPHRPTTRRIIAEDDFYLAPRPREEPGFLARAAASRVRFGLVLFAVGWTGILLQLGFLRQLVIGAPVFEELAKLGPPLVLVALLGARGHAARLPWAWISGAGFGAFEHYLTYPDESLLLFAERIAFHAGATGLSMALFTNLETLSDVRARWVTTVPATVLHWVNNFGALVFAFFAAFLPFMEMGMFALALLVTLSTYLGTLLIVLEPTASRRRFDRLAHILLPQLAEKHTLSGYEVTDLEDDPTTRPAPPAEERGPPNMSDEAPTPAPEPDGPPEEPR